MQFQVYLVSYLKGKTHTNALNLYSRQKYNTKTSLNILDIKVNLHPKMHYRRMGRRITSVVGKLKT